jgi:CRP-like cAMP-binding protein
MRKQDRVAQLRRVPLFEGCSKRDLNFLATQVKVEQLDAGQPLITEGAPATHLYLVLAGTASVARGGKHLGTVRPGETVGEIGLVLGEERNASVTADSPIELLALDRESLRKAMDDVPGLGWKILETVTARLVASSTRQTWS